MPESGTSEADPNNLETERRVLADCEQVFEDVSSGAYWNRPGLSSQRATLSRAIALRWRRWTAWAGRWPRYWI